MQHISGLDGLRALAVLLVMAYHLSMRRLPGGFLGVDLFFVLSGFLITTLLIRDRVSLRTFYVRRARRILPPLIAATALAVAIGVTQPGAAVPVLLFFANLVPPQDIRGMQHAWSLAIEEHFYLAWPLLLTGSKHRVALLVAAIALSLGLRIAFAGTGADVLYRATPMRLDGLAIGCLCAILFDGKKLPARNAFVIAGAFALMVAVAFLDWRSPTLLTYGLTCIAILCAALILKAREGEFRWLNRPWLEYIGQRSYGLYLYHFPIYAALALPIPAYALAALKVAATFAVAELSYRTIERLAIKRHIAIAASR